MQTIILDTNVLLADPSVLLAYPEAEILIPETVLGELDKLKTSRVDPDLRYRGREVSRELFDLSEQGNLTEGVTLPEGGKLRVAALDESDMPEGLSTRNADDRILGVAVQESRGRADVILVTNDLNMLLKAQTLGVRVQRHGEGVEGSFGRKYIIRPFQRYRIPLTILMIALAVFAAIIVLVFAFQPGPDMARSQINVPPELRVTLDATQQRILQLLSAIEDNPNDADARLQLGNIFFELHNYSQAATQYEQYLRLRPNDGNARADLGTAYYYSGRTDQGIRTVNKVLADDPQHIRANFNLGIMLWQDKRDFAAALKQFQKVEQLTATATQGELKNIHDAAARNIEQIQRDAAAADVPLETTGGVQ